MRLLDYLKTGFALWTNEPELNDLQVRSQTRDGAIITLNLCARWHGSEEETDCRITLDLDRRQVDWGLTTAHLFNRQHQGDRVRAMIHAAPAAILLFPFVIRRRRAYEEQERERELTRFSAEVLLNLEGRVEKNVWDALREALQKTWRLEQFLSRYVTRKEAAELLSDCRLVVESEEDDGVSVHLLAWTNADGIRVAFTTFAGNKPDVLYVLGSNFYGQDAERLLTCYRERIEQTRFNFPDH